MSDIDGYAETVVSLACASKKQFSAEEMYITIE